MLPPAKKSQNVKKKFIRMVFAITIGSLAIATALSQKLILKAQLAL